MNLEIYNPELTVKSNSIISGKIDTAMRFDDPLIPNTPLMREFLADDDIQQIQIVSTNYGFVKTFIKSYRRKDSDRGSTDN